MVVVTVILSLLVVSLILLAIFKKEWLLSIFGNSVVGKVEKKKKIEGEIEVLKKQQKVEIENIIKTYDQKKANLIDTTNAQIGSLQAQIAALKANKETQTNVLNEEKKVDIDRKTNEYNQKIVSKTNQSKKLGYLIEAEQKNLADVISPNQPNQPTEQPKPKLLLESSTETELKTADVKVKKTKKQ